MILNKSTALLLGACLFQLSVSLVWLARLYTLKRSTSWRDDSAALLFFAFELAAPAVAPIVKRRSLIPCVLRLMSSLMTARCSSAALAICSAIVDFSDRAWFCEAAMGLLGEANTVSRRFECWWSCFQRHVRYSSVAYQSHRVSLPLSHAFSDIALGPHRPGDKITVLVHLRERLQSLHSMPFLWFGLFGNALNGGRDLVDAFARCFLIHRLAHLGACFRQQLRWARQSHRGFVGCLLLCVASGSRWRRWCRWIPAWLAASAAVADIMNRGRNLVDIVLLILGANRRLRVPWLIGFLAVCWICVAVFYHALQAAVCIWQELVLETNRSLQSHPCIMWYQCAGWIAFLFALSELVGTVDNVVMEKAGRLITIVLTNWNDDVKTKKGIKRDDELRWHHGYCRKHLYR